MQYPSQGDIIWINLDPTRGREQRGRRPVIVLSATKFNRATGFVIAVPLSSRDDGSKFNVVVKAGTIGGVALTMQVRTLDLTKRPFDLSGERCPLKELVQIASILSSYIDVSV